MSVEERNELEEDLKRIELEWPRKCAAPRSTEDVETYMGLNAQEWFDLGQRHNKTRGMVDGSYHSQQECYQLAESLAAGREDCD